MKAYVLYYSRKTNIDGNLYNLNHYKFFLTKFDLSEYLLKQDDNFFPIAIRKQDVSNSTILDKNYLEIKLSVEKANEKH